MSAAASAIPFWETERGTGPVTEWLRSRELLEKLKPLNRYIRLYEGSLARSEGIDYGCHWVMQARRHLQWAYDERRELYEQFNRAKFAPIGLYDRKDPRHHVCKQRDEGDGSTPAYEFGNAPAAVRSGGYDGNGNRWRMPMRRCP